MLELFVCDGLELGFSALFCFYQFNGEAMRGTAIIGFIQLMLYYHPIRREGGDRCHFENMKFFPQKEPYEGNISGARLSYHTPKSSHPPHNGVDRRNIGKGLLKVIG